MTMPGRPLAHRQPAVVMSYPPCAPPCLLPTRGALLGPSAACEPTAAAWRVRRRFVGGGVRPLHPCVLSVSAALVRRGQVVGSGYVVRRPDNRHAAPDRASTSQG